MTKSVKDASIEVVREGLLMAVSSHDGDKGQAEDIFAAALEDIRSDITLFALSRTTPVPEHQLGRRTARHAEDFKRILSSTGLSMQIIRLVSRQLYMEMSEQLHLTHKDHYRYNLQPQMAV